MNLTPSLEHFSPKDTNERTSFAEDSVHALTPDFT